jgi:hypothetical protein
VAEDDDESRAEPFRGEFDAGDLRRSDDVPCYPDDEQVSEPLIEDDLGRDPRIGASENDRERFLTGRHLEPALGTGKRMPERLVRLEAAVALA